MSESDNIVINKNLIVEQSELINKKLEVDSGTAIGGDLNSNNQNVFGLLSVYDNIYSSGDIFLQSVINDKDYLYLKNDGGIICKNIEMDDHISIGTNDVSVVQPSNSIVINASGDILTAGTKGLFVDPIRNRSGEKALYYNVGTKEISYSDVVNGSTGPTGQSGPPGPTGPSINVSQVILTDTNVLDFDMDVVMKRSDNNELVATNLIKYQSATNTVSFFRTIVPTDAEYVALGSDEKPFLDLNVSANSVFVGRGTVDTNYIKYDENSGNLLIAKGAKIASGSLSDPDLDLTTTVGVYGTGATEYSLLDTMYFNGNYFSVSKNGSDRVDISLINGGINGNTGTAYSQYNYWDPSSEQFLVETGDTVHIGTNAGGTKTKLQGSGAVAIGYQAGYTDQDEYAVAIGAGAGYTAQGSLAVAIGNQAQYSSGATGSIAIGYQAGYTGQGGTVGYSVAIGYRAGQTGQGDYAVAMGYQAGASGQSSNAVAIGENAGYSGQGISAVAMGFQAGKNTQGGAAVAIGLSAGKDTQGGSAVAIGNGAGVSNQRSSAVAIGLDAGCDTQGPQAVAIGENAGNSTQGVSAVAIGVGAGYSNQKSYTVAIGNQAQGYNGTTGSIAIGYQAGYTAQGGNTGYAVAIGADAGYTAQGSLAVAIGREAQKTSGTTGSIAIGYQAGYTAQGGNTGYAVAIGYGAGTTGQGQYSIAIGYGAGSTGISPFNQGNNSIILNASGANLNSGASGFYVNPIIGNTSNLSTVLMYNNLTSEITYSSSNRKTFVIDHPLDQSKYLVHACLEGPEAGVYYRGTGEITNNDSVSINLPDYVSALATDFTIQITPIYEGKRIMHPFCASTIINNKFEVYGDNGKFYWHVYGKRGDINVEPIKTNVNVKGFGPYKFMEN